VLVDPSKEMIMTSTFGGRRALRPPLLATLAVAAVLALTACGSQGEGGVASANGGKGGDGSASSAGKQGNRDDQLVRFAKCMRDKGVDVRDPKPGDPGVRLRRRAEDPATKQKAQKAWKACESHLPEGFGNRDNDPRFRDQALKFARCMRANGVNVPDPGPDGGLRIENPESPEFKRAQEKCKQYRPNGGGG
jgi:hypothetical protein